MSTDAPLPPPTLAQQLEALMAKTRIDHDELVHKIGLLGLTLFERDSEVMRRLEAVKEGQERRACEITGLVETIRSRIGYIPPPEAMPLFSAGDPRAGALDYMPNTAGGVH